MTLRVAFIDDRDIVRSGCAAAVAGGRYSGGGRVQQRGAGARRLPGLEAEICICDISMPDGSGLDLLADIPPASAW